MALEHQMVRSAALGAAILIGFGLCAPKAQAAYVVTIEQIGSDVLATGSGSINFDALTFFIDESDSAVLGASDGVIVVGPTILTDDTYYSGIMGPDASFGGGGEFFGSSGGGGLVGLATFVQTSGGVVVVPRDYVSGAPLGTSTATWADAGISSLGLTPGMYVWKWGSGTTADTFTLDIVAAPEPATWAMMFLGLAGLALVRVRRAMRLQFETADSSKNF
jgi:hypothetical protein